MRPGLRLGIIIALLAAGAMAVGLGGHEDAAPPAISSSAPEADGKTAVDADAASAVPKEGQPTSATGASPAPAPQQAQPAGESGGSNFWMWYSISRMAGDLFDGFGRGRHDPSPAYAPGRGAGYEGGANTRRPEETAPAAPPPQQRSRFGSSYSKDPQPAPAYGGGESGGRSRFSSSYGKRSGGGGFSRSRRR